MKQEEFKETYDEFIKNNEKICEIEGTLGFKAELYTNGLIRYYKNKPNLIMPFDAFLSMEMKTPLLGKAQLFTRNLKGKKTSFMVCKDKKEGEAFLNQYKSQLVKNKLIAEALLTDAITSNIANKVNSKTNSLTDELEKAHELYEKGILTKDEFNEIKKKILKE